MRLVSLFRHQPFLTSFTVGWKQGPNNKEFSVKIGHQNDGVVKDYYVQNEGDLVLLYLDFYKLYMGN